jgi:hypothetical protein
MAHPRPDNFYQISWVGKAMRPCGDPTLPMRPPAICPLVGLKEVDIFSRRLADRGERGLKRGNRKGVFCL